MTEESSPKGLPERSRYTIVMGKADIELLVQNLMDKGYSEQLAREWVSIYGS